MAVCDKCGKEIFFIQNERTEKWLPYSTIGRKLHFNDCPKRDPRENIVYCVEHSAACKDGVHYFLDSWGEWVEHKQRFNNHSFKRWSRREMIDEPLKEMMKDAIKNKARLNRQ